MAPSALPLRFHLLWVTPPSPFLQAPTIGVQHQEGIASFPVETCRNKGALQPSPRPLVVADISQASPDSTPIYVHTHSLEDRTPDKASHLARHKQGLCPSKLKFKTEASEDSSHHNRIKKGPWRLIRCRPDPGVGGQNKVCLQK